MEGLYTFKGKNIKEMDKEELLEALEYAFKEIVRLKKDMYEKQITALSQGSFI